MQARDTYSLSPRDRISSNCTCTFYISSTLKSTDCASGRTSFPSPRVAYTRDLSDPFLRKASMSSSVSQSLLKKPGGVGGINIDDAPLALTRRPRPRRISIRRDYWASIQDENMHILHIMVSPCVVLDCSSLLCMVVSDCSINGKSNIYVHIDPLVRRLLLTE